MSATLKDLAPAEKQKVARLIRQVVEKERQLRELQAAAAARPADVPPAPSAAAAKAEQLAEQNQELARDNTSLRAKLSHAFDLLRAYQHKCRVLDVTLQVAGGSLATTRPTTPGSSWEPAGVHPHQLAARLASLAGSSGSAFLADSLEGNGPDLEPLAGAACAVTSGRLSPVEEAVCEGGSPDHVQPPEQAGGAHALAMAAWTQQQQAQQGQHGQQAQQVHGADILRPMPEAPFSTASPPLHQSSSADALAGVAAGPGGHVSSGVQLVWPQAALPQLETLKLMAQALLEAQAEVAAKARGQGLILQQQWQQQAQQGQQQGQQGQQQQGQPVAAQHGQPVAVQEGWAGCAAGPPLAGSSAAMLGAEASMQACSDGGSSSSSPAAPLAHVNGRAPLAAVQPQQQQPLGHSSGGFGAQQQAVAGACGSGGSRRRVEVFDGDLMDLVRDVEGMLQPEQSATDDGSWHSGGADVSSGGWQSGFGSGAASWAPSRQATYEENDLLDLIAQL